MNLNSYFEMLGINTQREEESIESISLESAFPLTMSMDDGTYETFQLINQTELDYDRLLTAMDLLERNLEATEDLANSDGKHIFDSETADMLVKVTNAHCLRAEGEDFSFTKSTLFVEKEKGFQINNVDLAGKARGVKKALVDAALKLWEMIKKFFSENFTTRGSAYKLAKTLQKAKFDPSKSFKTTQAMTPVLDIGTGNVSDGFSYYALVFGNFIQKPSIEAFITATKEAVTKAKKEESKQSVDVSGPVIERIIKDAGEVFDNIDEDYDRSKETTVYTLSIDDLSSLLVLEVDKMGGLSVKYKDRIKLSGGFQSQSTSLAETNVGSETDARLFANLIVDQIDAINRLHGKMFSGNVKRLDYDGTVNMALKSQMEMLRATVTVQRAGLSVLAAANKASK